MPTPQQIPEKTAYRSSEVCQYTDTQPYVLRFWESEFPQLSPQRTRGGQAVYTRRDIDLVMRIKQLLYDEEYTLTDARQRLEQELRGEGGLATGATPAPSRGGERPGIARGDRREQPAPMPAPLAQAREGGAAPRPGRPSIDSVARERYEDAVDEIAHLRLQLKEAETRLRRAEHLTREAEERAAEHQRRCARAIERLQQLLELVS